MNEAPSICAVKKRVLPFERVVLALQGGGALGAYQAGVYAAIAEAGIELDWISGISIGAINAALIVGNPPEKRVARLREFWEKVTEPPVASTSLSWLSELPWPSNGRMRALESRVSAATASLHGAPSFFAPRPFPPFMTEAESPVAVSLYDTAPLRATLQKMVDFDLINKVPMRLTVSATNVRNGQPVAFDNTERQIGVDHIMASASLPPGFPATEIDGEYYWDGGVVSNSATDIIVDSPAPRYKALLLQVDLWDQHGDAPLTIAEANLRAMEIHSAGRIRMSVEEFRKLQHFRRALGKLLDQVPEACRNDPDMLMLREQAEVQSAMVVQLRYQTRKYESASKIFDFSRRAMIERWQSGYEDARSAFAEPGVLELPQAPEWVRVFDVRRGWFDVNRGWAS